MITPEELAAHETEIAALLALIGTLESQAVVDRDDISNLHIALDSARLIGTAIGIVMATSKVTQVEAFNVLARASQDANRKLRDIAGDVVETGVVPQVRTETVDPD